MIKSYKVLKDGKIAINGTQLYYAKDSIINAEETKAVDYEGVLLATTDWTIIPSTNVTNAGTVEKTLTFDNGTTAIGDLVFAVDIAVPGTSAENMPAGTVATLVFKDSAGTTLDTKTLTRTKF